MLLPVDADHASATEAGRVRSNRVAYLSCTQSARDGRCYPTIGIDDCPWAACASVDREFPLPAGSVEDLKRRPQRQTASCRSEQQSDRIVESICPRCLRIYFDEIVAVGRQREEFAVRRQAQV